MHLHQWLQILLLGLLALHPLRAQDSQPSIPLRIGDIIKVELYESAAYPEEPTRIRSAKVDEVGKITVFGLKAAVQAEGLTPSEVEAALTAAWKAESTTPPLKIVVPSPPREQPPEPPRLYPIHPGAFIKIDVSPQIPKDAAWYVVSKDGNLHMPGLKGTIQVNCLTLPELEKAITEAYAKEKIEVSPKITIGEYGHDPNPPPTVTVSGEVKTPQEFDLSQKITLKEAIEKAGGFGEFANPRKVKLLRGNRAEIYDLREIKPDGSNNPELRDGDLVIVSQ